jgi:hypothetical protein
LAAEQSAPALGAKKAAGACFAAAGKPVDRIDPAEPIQSFFSLTDSAALHAGNRREVHRIERDMGRIYARCTKPYFATITDYLAKRRPAIIERNRELLERFAGEIAAAGYVP